jgi:hypothetical protein
VPGLFKLRSSKGATRLEINMLLPNLDLFSKRDFKGEFVGDGEFSTSS